MSQTNLLGAIIGDVVGSTRERHNVKTEQFDLLPPGSCFTDDTVMTLAVAQWLMEDPRHSASSLVSCMTRLGQKYPHAGYGHSFRNWLREEHPLPYGSYGNGSAMRVSPVGLFADSLEECLELAKTTAMVSHNHPEGVKGAQAVAACVYLHRLGVNRSDIKRYIEQTFGYHLDINLEELRPRYRFDSSCQGSVPVAIACFLQRLEPERVLRLAVSMGGDSDTIAAIAYGIATAPWVGYNELACEVGKMLPDDLRNINDRFFSFLSQRYESRIRDSIRGSLIAGACGDALGYEVEFSSRSSILDRFGSQGITQFVLHNGKALVSDDTQMTLFTANGMLMGITRGCMRGIGGCPEDYVDRAYMDWYLTQYPDEQEHHITSWIYHVPELHHRRAPGCTCLSAIHSLMKGDPVQNDSMGCGGIMRVAPMGLLLAGYWGRQAMPYDCDRMLRAAGQVAKMTHKHPLGYLPAALLSHLIYRLTPLSPMQAREMIRDLVDECMDSLVKAYPEQESYCKELTQLTRKAVVLALGPVPDAEALPQLGEGWVGHEAWAIALYCALRHLDSPEQALIAAVNHNGDSDSTGSICGNIMGAIYGYEYLRQQRLCCPDGHQLEDCLELHPVILELADDLSTSCIISEYENIDSPEKRRWYRHYCEWK